MKELDENSGTYRGNINTKGLEMSNLIVNNYVLRKELYDYGNGAVLYLAEEISQGVLYFIKKFSKSGIETAVIRDSFYTEAKNLAHLNHENILQAIDFFEDAGCFYLVQEHFTFFRLDEIIGHHGRSKVLPTLHVIKQVLRALSFAHSRGVQHRGIRATNVYVSRNGKVKLDGFGASNPLLADTGTSANFFAGTTYMSPEQIVNPKSMDQRSDIYSVGMLMYQMLSGEVLRSESSTIIQLMRQTEEDLPDIREKLPEIDRELAEAINRSVSRSPDHRFQNGDEFIAALERYQHRDALDNARKEKVLADKTRRRKLVVRGAAAIILLACLSWGGWYLLFAEKIQTVLRLQGSNTIGAKLAPALVEEFLKCKGAYKTRRQQGANQEELTIVGSMGGTKAWAVEIKSHGSGTAFEGLEKSACDIGMASRPVKKEELEKLSSLGDLTQYGSEHVIGLDGLAVIVNAANPVPSASKDTIARIFAGEVTSWKDVGGSNNSIKLFARDDKSGTYDTFKSLVMDKRKLHGGAQRYEDSSKLSADVSNDPSGIGFIGLPYIKSSKPIAITVGDNSFIYPTAFTVATEEYPLSRRLYMYVPPRTSNPLVREFIEFTLSDEGQDVVEKIGFISLAVKSEIPVLSEKVPTDFRALVQGADRLSLSFRFRPGTISFDNRSRRDLERLVHSLERKEMQGRKIMLFGFSDSSEGNNAQNTTEQWARLVAGELASRGIKPELVKGMGPVMQVAEGGSHDGKLRNNRVEIWLSRR
jgi:phosphate transport system substrate-binding protein